MGGFIKLVVLVLLFLSLSVMAALGYHNFFATPKIAEKEVGPYLLATKRYVGSYSKINPTMKEVENVLKELNVYSTKGAGLYYDDPAQQKESELRSDVGVILEGVDEATIRKIEENLEIKEINRQMAIVVEYPIKSPLSYTLGAMKAYPAISKYWTERGYPDKAEGDFDLEIYDLSEKKIYYIMLVPE